MIKYRVILSDSIVEFSNEESASSFAVDNNASYEQFEELESVDIPQSATPRQIRVALIMSGISVVNIEAMIDALSEPDQSIVRATWEYSTVFERFNPILNSMAEVLGLGQSDIDDLFILAESL